MSEVVNESEAPELTRAQEWGLDPIEEPKEVESDTDVENEEAAPEQEEGEAEADTEVEEDDADEDDTSSESDDDDTEDDNEDDADEVNPLAAINENLNKAVKAERDRRKLAIKEAETLRKELEVAKLDNSTDEVLEDVKAQLKALDLEDLVTIKEPKKEDPEVTKLRHKALQDKEQERLQGVVTNMREEVTVRLAEYPEIDGTSMEQGELIGNLILASVETGGMDLEEAVEKTLAAFNNLLKSKVDSYKQKRQPKVVPKKKTKTVGRTKQAISKDRKFNNGDIDGFFKDIGGSLLGE